MNFEKECGLMPSRNIDEYLTCFIDKVLDTGICCSLHNIRINNTLVGKFKARLSINNILE